MTWWSACPFIALTTAYLNLHTIIRYPMLFRSLIVSTILTVSAASSVAYAEVAEHEHHAHAMATKGSASDRAYGAVMQKMHKTMHVSLSGNPDVDFVRQMIPHHQAAVDMAKVQQKYGHDTYLKNFNDWVIAAQEKEIALMKNWLRRKDNGLSSANAKDYYGESMATMHEKMMITYTGDADVDYARGMIPHHQGAVDMARILLAEGKDPELQRLANDIYSSQTQEIAKLERWLNEHNHR